jgi:transposase
MPHEMSPGKPTTRRYSEAEKDRAVRMVFQLRKELGTDHGTVKRVAQQLGMGVESLRGWVKQREVDEGLKPGTTTADAARIAELEQEVRELRRANSILKSSAAFFAAELCATRRCVIREVVRNQLRWAVAAA